MITQMTFRPDGNPYDMREDTITWAQHERKWSGVPLSTYIRYVKKLTMLEAIRADVGAGKLPQSVGDFAEFVLEEV